MARLDMRFLPAAILLWAACSGTNTPGSDGGAATDSGTPSADGGSGDAGGDTWTNWANASFFQPYCDSCHTPGGAGDPAGTNLDFTQYANVAANAAVVRCGVAAVQDPAWGCGPSPVAAQFPVGTGAKPSNGERARLVAWIDAGHPQ
jgi:hypothetical protein